MRFIRLLLRFAVAWFRWRSAGAVRRHSEFVWFLFYRYCDICGHYDPRSRECTLCGCTVSPNSDERNKLVYATERCPDSQFPANVEVDAKGRLVVLDREMLEAREQDEDGSGAEV
jgi:hypothetical protein